jgi:DNA-binding transcriptional MerR regulator
MIEMNRFSIKDIENLTGIKAHTLRIWEQRYGILQPQRTDTNIRYYDGDDLKNALRVSLLNSHGYKISIINKMNEEEIDAVIAKITDVGFRLQATVNEMLEYTIAMDTERFEQLLDNHISRNGVDKTVELLIFTFLEKIGLMWMTSKIFPAQEHIVSNIITRKLALATEQLKRNNLHKKKKMLLFLPEGEVHDIGLLYMQYLAYKNNCNPIYLGQNTPISEAELVYEMKKPEYIYIHITTATDNFEIDQYLKKIGKTFPASIVLISGSILHHAKVTSAKNVRLLYTLAEARNAVNNID